MVGEGPVDEVEVKVVLPEVMQEFFKGNNDIRFGMLVVPES